MKLKKIYINLIFLLVAACAAPSDYESLQQTPDMFPDYADVTVPCNIAPLNFRINGIDRHRTWFVAGRDSFVVTGRSEVTIPLRKWKRLLATHHNNEQLFMKIYAEKDGRRFRYPPVAVTIAPDSVDSYFVYRLVDPCYHWGHLGIYQRDLSSFAVTPVLTNSLTDGNCMNCHSFCQNNPRKMLLHLRAENAGTLFVNNGKTTKVNTKVKNNVSAGVYPRWHPDGRYVAFSVNMTLQLFHSMNQRLIEVYDAESDLVLYDTETMTLLNFPLLRNPNMLETFPEWSPDGHTLFFCNASSLYEEGMPRQFGSYTKDIDRLTSVNPNMLPSFEVRYGLFSVSFDPDKGNIGSRIDTVLIADGKSVSHPRISPDGKYILLNLSDFGTFPIWQESNDLYLLDMQTRELRAADELNSPRSDSYHCWTTNGRWVVFSSRRIDGIYTHPYIAYFDKNGRFGKPFIIPQKYSYYYEHLMRSFNIPEFVTGKIEPDIRTLESVSHSAAQPVKEETR
ncbi:MAG: hypothetical protein LBR06_08795 [Bacteroidales bacterium]|jgi:hypothetical protein|nr:hypothetical protein [Bacteroidales bacterium]